MNACRAHRRRGFSLLEAMVGVAIAVALLSALALFTTNLGDTRARLARLSREIECTEALFTALERGCATAVVASPSLGSGVSGDATTLRFVRAAVGLGNDGRPAFSGESEVSIAFDTSGRRISIVRGTLADTLSAPVRRMRIRYLAERGWEDSFDSGAEQSFPVGIEVALWFDRGEAIDDAVRDDPDADALPLSEPPPDRRRFFRCTGGPKADPLAIRSILDEGDGAVSGGEDRR
ncbi:MAG: prepilin-type N-terminal cleavage/methylation domain-containing protein [Phycisphaerales bacterium]|jgi:hypothetical protein